VQDGKSNDPLPIKDLDLSKYRYIDGKLYKEVGCADTVDYKRISIGGINYLLHRVIFFLCHGYEPDVVDHIDRDRSNNSIENLRAATKSQNAQNCRIRSDNTSGFRNVNWHRQKRKWQVTLTLNGKRKSYGLFDDKEEAGRVAQEARERHYGNFAS
jgi:hypothetical protein